MPWQRLGMSTTPGTSLYSNTAQSSCKEHMLQDHCWALQSHSAEDKHWGWGWGACTSNTPRFWNSVQAQRIQTSFSLLSLDLHRAGLCAVGQSCSESGISPLSPWWYSRALLKDALCIRYLILLQKRENCLMIAPREGQK